MVGKNRKSRTCTNKEWMKCAAWHRYKIRLGEWILRLSGKEMKVNRCESFDVSMGCWIVQGGGGGGGGGGGESN